MRIFSLLLTVLPIFSCTSLKEQTATQVNKTEKSEPTAVTLEFNDGPQTIIYKTTRDYKTFVPVILSKDKSEIVSYPHPKDLFYNGKFAYPTQLNEGFLLDNKGINTNVAFLNTTYEKYAKLDSVPSLNDLYEMILDKSPLIELYNCGNKYAFNNLLTDLNSLIESNVLNECKCHYKQ